MMRVLPPVLLIALAAGCRGHGTPHTFASCGRSVTHDIGIKQATFDCLAEHYRRDCSPAQAVVSTLGFRAYRVRLFGRDGECTGDVRPGAAAAPVRCDYGVSLMSPESMGFYGCGEDGERDVVLTSHLYCGPVRLPPHASPELRELRGRYAC
jgi:hypothetical protein